MELNIAKAQLEELKKDALEAMETQKKRYFKVLTFISYGVAPGILSVGWLDEIELVPRSIVVFVCPRMHIHIDHKNVFFIHNHVKLLSCLFC